LILSDRFGRACELEENRSLRAFDNSAQQAITLFWRACGGPGSAHSGVSTGDVHGGDLQAFDSPLVHLGRIFGWFAIGLLELTNPPVDIRFNAAALALAEVVNGALTALLVTRNRRNLISCQPHRPLTLRFPIGRNSPVDTGAGVGP
jgi:hypothetical protein